MEFLLRTSNGQDLVLPLHRLSVGDFHKMVETGILGEDDRIELIEGELIEMVPIGSRHAACVKRLLRGLDRQVGEAALVSVQDPVVLSDHSEVQPDLMLLKPRWDFYAERHPWPGEVLLLIEVADTTGDSDRQVKLPLYARYGIPEVWLVALAQGEVEVYRQPSGEEYQESERAGRSSTLIPTQLPQIQMPVEELLP